jgi:hypothetical protein
MTNEKVFIATDRQTLKELLSEMFGPIGERKKEPDLINEKMDRRQAAKFLGVSYQTMFNWTKAGILKEHGHGRKKFYLRSELIEAMKNSG